MNELFIASRLRSVYAGLMEDSIMPNVTPKAKRLRALGDARKPADLEWSDFMGTHDYGDAQTGASRSARCDYFDALKTMGWRQGDPVPGMPGTGDPAQAQKAKALAADKKRASARLGDRGY
jgi:hypothetical protein